VTHLIADLLQHHDPVVLSLILIEVLLGGGACVAVLLRGQAGRRHAGWMPVVFAGTVTLTAWLSFRTALAGRYPNLAPAIPFAWMLPALGSSLSGGLVAGLIQQLGRRSARNALLAGSLLACGFSCMVFTGMAGLVRPFALAYDLTSVLTIMVLGAALCGFGFWEVSGHTSGRGALLGGGLIALAIALLTLGSLAAILPFGGWMSALTRPEDLASSPIAVIVAAESVAVLVLSLSGSLVDNRVAARDRLEADRLRQLADSTLEGILIHRDGAILDGNESLAALLGLELAELRSSPVARFIVPGSDTAPWNPERGATAVETEILAADGSRLPVEILSRHISYAGRPAMVTALRDVRERRASEERIRFLAHHDVLTELPNRVMLKESLDVALRLAARSATAIAVLCLDLDGFKTINDTLGHGAGDQLLCQVAERLRRNLRDSDLIARIGGDEFVVLQNSGAQPDEATVLARRIIECLGASFQIDGQDVNVGTSVGIAVYPQDGTNAATLLKNGDIALYRAKENGRGWFCLFETGMDQMLRQRRELEQDLRAALAARELTLDFQPLFDGERRLISFEALVRWTHPTHGAISPAQFIPLAEECGLIIPLGEWVIRTACSEAMSWKDECRVAVNLSPAQFRRGNLCALVSDVLAETGLPAHRLELEITEGVLIDDTEMALLMLQDLRALGIRLVLDDFGTGYSSLSYLHRFPFDKLKVDRSFIQRMGTDESSRAIVNAIISMSRNLNLEVTAEGVETVEQLELLCAQGCNELQGFLLGRPMPQATIAGFVVDQSRSDAAAA